MSKRCSPVFKAPRAIGAVLALLILVLLAATPNVQAAPTQVSIGFAGNVPPGTYATIDITADNSGSLRELGGFDFLVAYDAAALTLIEATAGASLDSCAWEYFTYRTGATGDCGGPCPTGFVRLVAIAETNNGNAHPSCFLSGVSGSLASLKFLVSSEAAYECLYLPVEFYWFDCGDNAFSSPSGDTLYLSRRVFSYFGPADLTGQTGIGGWQGIIGHPDCLNPTRQVALIDTAIDFHNGGIETACADSVDNRGDINLNGIANEIADLVTFGNYFLHGLSAFPAISPQSSVAATDINADGKVLTYSDLVYLGRIIEGDAVPFPKRFDVVDTLAYFVQDTTNHSVSVTYSGTLPGAVFEFVGQITPTFSVPVGLFQDYYFDGTITHVAMLSRAFDRYGSGVWFTYQGTGRLLRVRTSDVAGFVDFDGKISGVANDCGNVDGVGNVNISDVVFLIRYIFAGGPPPNDGHGGDVNCDGSCDIGDAVYLMHYIFAGGAIPCASCK